MNARPKITLIIAEPKWRATKSLAPLLKRASLLALERADVARGEVTILLADDARLRELNALFRGKNAATNVLSFPAAPNATQQLGDVAIGYGITAREAKAEGKSLLHHATHLAVHGTLHLLGYDHVRIRDARKMEKLETEILGVLKIPDPYVSRKAA